MSTALLLVSWFTACFITYLAWNATYRLLFHPLARVPGLRIAAVTSWWECYQDLFVDQGGEFTNKVEALHDIYGPIVRITPDEVHIRDPEWALVLYAGPGHVQVLPLIRASFGTVSHHTHRRRRAPGSAFYSKSSVAKNMYDKIWRQAGVLCEVLVRSTFLGWSNDTLSICSFGDSQDLLHDVGKVTALIEVFTSFAAAFPILRQCGCLIPFALALPVTPIRYISKRLAMLLDTHLNTTQGSTAARTMGVAIYHIVANPEIKQCLKRELSTAMPGLYDHIELKLLEQLPLWLNAVLKESLRIDKTTDHRLGLIAPTEALQYKEWTLPPGVSLCNSSAYRWLQSDEQQLAAMSRVFMPFAHGRRGCLGMQYVGLACLFRRVDFELYDTIRERDVDHTWSHAAGEPSKGSKALRFRVTADY
ncbi:cytochrome P450 [Aspergillus insuetus]